MDQIRSIRNNFLLQTDKYILSDYPLTTEQRNNIISYRQQLRDLPNNLQGTEIDISNIGIYFPNSPVSLINPFY